MSIGIGLLFSLVFAVIAAVFAAIRGQDQGAGAAVAAILVFALVLIEDWAIHSRPEMTFSGLLPLILANVATLCVCVWIADVSTESVSAGTFLAPAALLALVITFLIGYNSGHSDVVKCPPNPNAGLVSGQIRTCSKAAYGIVPVTEFTSDTLPASVTTNLVIVTADQAAARASTAMQNYASQLSLGPATLQMVAGQMWYVFPLEFEGAINKHRLGSVEPGYIMVSAQDSGGASGIPYVTRFGGPYSMVVSLAGGQGSEPDRWARDHGYTSYLLDNPTLEIADNGDPYYTLTLLRPQIGWTFQAPVGVLAINAHTGQITRYDLPGRGAKNPAPSWIDRVYSQAIAAQIGNWYGFYAHAPFGGQGNTNRYELSGDPDLVYTGDGNPSWRMLLTSFNTTTAVHEILEMDAASGAIQVYTPAHAMGIEATVDAAFCNGQGVGTSGKNIPGHLVPEGLALHEIDGTLTWLTSYEPAGSETADNAPDQQEGDVTDPCGNGTAPAASPTFSGIGLVPAYATAATSVVYGATLDQALANYQQELADLAAGGSSAASAGSTQLTVTGRICGKADDTSAGNETYLITLCTAAGKPDYSVVYTGQSANLGYAIVLAQPGDSVILGVSKFSKHASEQQIQSFSDAQHPVSASG